MRCEELQTKIAVHDALSADEIRHAESCPDCREFAHFNGTLSARLDGWREEPTVLRPRATRRMGVRSPRLAFTGVGLAALLTVALVALPTRSPARPSAQAAYQRMIHQTEIVRSVHLVVNWRPGKGNPEDGPLGKVYELWWRPGAWRESRPGAQPSLKRTEDGSVMFYRYDPASRSVTSYREIAPQMDYRTFDLATFATQYMDKPTRFEQPNATTIVAINGGGWSRMVFTVDPVTSLPSHATKQFRSGTHWETSGELEMEFNGAVPDARFDPADLAKSSAAPLD